jgi:hypothetical protein
LLWALNFANLPLLQFGIAAASLPILIHLLNRRRYREVPWAAMRFLMAAIRKNQRRVKVEQWLLLAIRTLLILFVVLAMAKPFLESAGALPFLPGQRSHRVIVLDGSLSMAYRPGESTRFDQAKSLAAQLVKDARRGDVLSVVMMGDPPRVIVGDASPSANQPEVLKELADLTLPHGRTDLTASFQAIDRVLEVSSIQRKEIIFLTDLQVASWRKTDRDDGLRAAVAKLEARKAQSIVIDLGKEGGENRAVTDIRLNAPVVTMGNPTPVLTATLRNFGVNPAPSVKAQLYVDGQLGPEQVVDLPVGSDVSVAFTPTISNPGDHVLEVRLDDDPLLLDNRRRLAVPVRESLRVLLVDGDSKTEAFQAETDYLNVALNPQSGSPGLPPVIRTEVASESQVARRDLSPYDVVVLCNVAQVTDGEVNALDAYLKQGGGLVVFGGDQVMAENYNRLLHKDGKGILPAAILGSMGDATKKSGSFEFNPLGFQHPIVAPFSGADANVILGLTGTRTWQYLKLKLPTETQAKVALAYNSGDPAVIEMPKDRGKVIQVATTADAGWSTWPLHPSYPPVMEQIILQAASGKLAERNIGVGQPIDQALPALATDAPAEVVRPDEARSNLKVKADGDIALFHFEETDLSGTYQVKYGPPLASESIFAANPDPSESDPAKLDRPRLQEAIPGWTFDYMTNWKDLTGNAAAVSRRGELHRPLLFGVLALLLIESVLAWKFGHHGASG